jgi:hypothetical protein
MHAYMHACLQARLLWQKLVTYTLSEFATKALVVEMNKQLLVAAAAAEGIAKVPFSVHNYRHHASKTVHCACTALLYLALLFQRQPMPPHSATVAVLLYHVTSCLQTGA